VRLRVLMEPRRGATYEQILALARAAEEAGLDGFFRGDHYLGIDPGDPSYLPTDSWTTLAGLAVQTSRIRLGTLMTAGTFRQPGSLAIIAASSPRPAPTRCTSTSTPSGSASTPRAPTRYACSARRCSSVPADRRGTCGSRPRRRSRPRSCSQPGATPEHAVSGPGGAAARRGPGRRDLRLRRRDRHAPAAPDRRRGLRPVPAADEVTVQDQLPLGPAEKKAFFQSNAERVFRL